MTHSYFAHTNQGFPGLTEGNNNHRSFSFFSNMPDGHATQKIIRKRGTGEVVGVKCKCEKRHPILDEKIDWDASM